MNYSMNENEEKIEKFIRTLKGISFTKNDLIFVEDKKIVDNSNYATASGIIEDIFMKGNCGNLVILLSIAFPEGKIYCIYDENENPIHCIFKLNDSYYDIRGKLDNLYIQGLKNCDYQIFPIEDEHDIEDIMDNYAYILQLPKLV